MRHYITLLMALLVARFACSAESSVVSVIERGDLHEMELALKVVAEARAQEIKVLTQFITTKKVDAKARTQVQYAIFALGNLRATEALETLIANIEFSIPPKDARLAADELPPPIQAQYPSTVALVELGPCAHEALFMAVAEGNLSPTGVRLAGWVIVQKTPKEERKLKLERYLTGLTDAQKRRLLHAEFKGFFE